MKLVLGSLLVLALPFAVARADRPPHHKPPQAAFDACAKAKAGDACSVQLHDQTLSGVCQQAPDAAALVCHVAHPGPPPEAIAACKDRAAGDACAVTHDGHDIAGTCTQHHGDGPLACHPSHGPHHE